MEEAFSVEKVTNEFFELYCEKYHELREFLDSNDDFVQEAKIRNFTSEQFAKKLLGQIVFLYFIQKKGWMGVDAIPVRMTEKEYNKAFYARGQKSKSIVSSVYLKQSDGTYKIVFEKLQELSDEDEEFLAGIVKGKPWGTGPKDFMRKMFDGCVESGKNYFDDYLEPLFYKGLNVNRGENGFYPALHRRIPFLNGGLFEQLDNYEWENNDFAIPNSIFSNVDEKGREADGILDIFDRYNFTMNEDEPMEREVAIDPEMLGKVFENLLDVKDRKSKGAFYTPREIVHYMCQETLISHLTGKTGISEEAIRDFILYGEYMRDEDTIKTIKVSDSNGKNHYEFDKEKDLLISEEILSFKENVNRLKELDDLLANIKVADLAVGSGAFPLGMLNEIVKARQVLTEYMTIGMNGFEKKSFITYGRKPYDLKVNTIKNCIFACDIEPSAVDIAKLRLWLSIVIDDEITEDAGDSKFDIHTKPRQLPNLDCNIVCGNSLIDEFKGIKLITESTLLNNVSENSQQTVFQSGVDAMISKLIEYQDKLFFTKNHDDKEELKANIQQVYDDIIIEQLQGNQELIDSYYALADESSKPFILWQLYFPKVFKENGGFDAVIGNPPYVDSEEMTQSMPKERELYSRNYLCAQGNWDLFVLFIEQGMNLLCKDGVISFIVPNKLVSVPYTEALRKMMALNQVLEIRDYSNVMVFKSAAVYPVVFRVKMNANKKDVVMDVMEDMEQVSTHNVIKAAQFYSNINWDKYFNSSQGELQIIDKMLQFKHLMDIAKVNGAATVNEAYLVKEIIFDDFGHCDEEQVKKFINTGGLDPYKSAWGVDYMRYLKGKYMCPMVKREDLKEISEKRLLESDAEKIIIGGMTKTLECFYDSGEYLAGKSTTIVYGCEHLKYITAVLNSKLMSFFYRIFYNSMSLAGGFFRIGAPQIKKLPIAITDDKKIIEIEIYVDKLLCDNIEFDERQAILEKIDDMVYDIYGLTEKEKNIVEQSK
ncbi:MAG: Eco57I restriction-modification methylase domain-containing protein [Clostridium sp.]|nr:Eco57I restriction-modification methylase domain-containing protein [Clostridium sp.]MCM1460585.1 Eco57I restriction-modification methylase domain-containing protein [Bacteroides sp.]